MSGNLREYVSTFYSCGRHKFALKVFLCITQYFYVVDSDM